MTILCISFAVTGGGWAEAIRLPSAATSEGVLARLLLNEVPFPGEAGYVSETDSKNSMCEILWVLHCRRLAVPAPYTRKQVANTDSSELLDIIFAAGQMEGFTRDSKGNPQIAARVETRLNYLIGIASKGEPGRFSRLLDYGIQLSKSYVQHATPAYPDIFAVLPALNGIPVTGAPYAWMTDRDYYAPGGDYIRIPDSNQGRLGGNRFHTLRKEPKP